jgi:(p)ppGpp synthase/HD superfamily hydrolase
LLDIQNLLDFKLINKAIYWARKYHGKQKRKSGEPYYSHPLEVAYMISDYKLKTDVIVASILHDIIEDTEVTAGMILDNFSWRIAEMVDRLTRNRPDGRKISVEEVLNNVYQKQDQDVLVIKLINRLHNMQTIWAKSPEKIEKTVNQTLSNFLSVTMHLGLLKIEKEMINRCLYYTSKEQKKIPDEWPFSFNNNSPLLFLI